MNPAKKDIKLSYNDVGAAVSFSSLNLDSADFSYDFDVSYDFFHYTKDLTMNHVGFSGEMAKLFEGFYVGSDLKFDHYNFKFILNQNTFFRSIPFSGKVRISGTLTLEHCSLLKGI